MHKLIWTLAVSMLSSSCASQAGNSQFLTDEENLETYRSLVAENLVLCDGLARSDHETCAGRIKSELASRFAERNEVLIRTTSMQDYLMESIIVSYSTQIVVESISGALDSSDPTKTVKGSSVTCVLTETQAPYSISLSSFVVVPVSCN